MAQNISLLGASYTGVPGVELPKTGGGTALFADPSVTTAVEADVAQGKIFLKADGSTGTGTATGGGGTGGVTQDQDGYIVLDDDAPTPSGITLNVTTMSSSTTTLNAYVEGVTELNIAAGSATAAKYCDKFMLYDVKFPAICNVTYSGMTALTSGTSKSDVLRQCNGIKTIDFGGVNAPTSLTRFYYNVSRQSYEKNYTMTIKGITWTNCTTFTNCFATSTAYSDWKNNGRYLDVEWNGTINATALSFRGGAGCFPFTHRSLVELLGALSSNGGTLNMGADNLATLTSDEIAVATAKGWTVSA